MSNNSIEITGIVQVANINDLTYPEVGNIRTARMTIVVRVKGSNKTEEDFLCVFFGRQAELVSMYIKPGEKIMVRGEMRLGNQPHIKASLFEQKVRTSNA